MVERLAGSTDPTFNARQIGFLTAAYVAAPVAAAFLWGKWSDLIGRRPVLVFGLIGFAGPAPSTSRLGHKAPPPSCGSRLRPSRTAT
nr:MFS transporter [Mesorhizobium sp.]